MVRTIFGWVLVICAVLAFTSGPSAAASFATSAGTVGGVVVSAAAKFVSAAVTGAKAAGGTDIPKPAPTPTKPADRAAG